MLQLAVDWCLFALIGLDSTTRVSKAINFFIYDSIKIVFLLFIMIGFIGFLRTYLPPERIKNWMANKHKIVSHIAAAIFGAITPFCSCSGIPIFLGFLKSGIPLGVAFTFLISSPLINEYLVVLMFGFFGFKITAIYVLSGLLSGIFLGLILDKKKLEDLIILKDNNNSSIKSSELYFNINNRIRFGFNEAVKITKQLWIWILVATAIGAAIHNFVPEDFIHSLISKGGIFTVPLAVIVGVPLYGSCAAIVPIALVLFNKGVPLGTALAFMMATAALSFPEAVILRSAMKLKLILIYFAVVSVSIIIIGYLINYIQPLL